MSAAVANSTAGAAVYRADGTRLYGFDAELELKMQAKRDPDFEKNILKWVEEVVGEKSTHPEDFGESLKTGTMLCKLINVVAPGSVKKVDMRNIALVHVENINAYLKACWNIGLPSSELFITSDLYGKKGIPQVVQNVFGVAKLAQSKPTWTGPLFAEVPKVKQINLTPAKKWEPVKTEKQMRRVEDIEAEMQEGEGDAMRVKELESELSELREKIHRNEVDKQSLVQRENTLTQENKQLKDKYNQAQKETEIASKSLVKSNAELKEANQTIENLKKNSAIQATQNSTVKPKEAEVDPILLKQLREKIEQLEKQLSTEKEGHREQKQLVKKIQKELEMEKQTKQDMAIQRQATINNLTLRKGSKEKPQTVESLEAEKAADFLSELSKLLHRIFFGKATDISSSDYLRFDVALQDELARRFFAKQLSKNLKQTAHYELQSGEFKCIEHLTSTCLREMMATSPDFITGKQLMRSGNKVNCKVDNSSYNAFLRDSIKDFEIFSSAEFWHDCFIDELNKKYHRYFPQDSGHAVDIDFVTTLTTSFVLQMGEWKVKDNVIERFIHEIPHNNHVGIKDPKELENHLKGFWVQAKSRHARYSQIMPGSPLSSFSRSFTSSSPPSVGAQASQSLSSIPSALLEESSPKVSRRKSTRFTGVNELRDSRAKKFTSTKEIPPGNPVKTGTLSVKSTLGWKSRTVILKDNFLLILKDQKSSKAETIIPLYYAQVAPSEKKTFAFIVGESFINRDSHVYISAPNDKERQDWISAVQQAIVQSQIPSPDSPSFEKEPTPDSATSQEEPAPTQTQSKTSNPPPVANPAPSSPAPVRATSSTSNPPASVAPVTVSNTPASNPPPVVNPTPSSPTPVRAPSASAPPAVNNATKGVTMALKPNPASITWVKLKAKAIESYSSTDPKELKFSEGDVIQITKQDNGGWSFGYVEGKEALKGWLPTSKVKQEATYIR